MVYFDYIDLGYDPFIKSWLATKPAALANILKDEIAKFVAPLLLFKRKNCTELVPINEVNAIQSMTRLFDTLVGCPRQNSRREYLREFSTLTNCLYLYTKTGL